MLGLLPLALLSLIPASSAGPAFGGAGGSVPPDPFAHPRFALSFLNDLPIGRSFADALVRRQEEQGTQPPAREKPASGPPSSQAELGRHAASDSAAGADVGWFFGAGPGPISSTAQRGEIAGSVILEGDDHTISLGAASESQTRDGGDGLPSAGDHTLQTFLLPPSRSYLCLLPLPEPDAPASPSPTAPVDDDEPAFDPELPERLLRHLSSSCLFVRAGWFTYSYCHNAEVRQFREKARGSWPPTADAWVPVIDDGYDDYVLGRATVPPYGESFDSTSFNPSSNLGSRTRAPHFDPRSGSTGGPSTSAADEDEEDDARRPIAPITLARGAGARYLTTRWGGGTTCDQTGDAREIEIQYHCSSRGTDALSLIKETATCSYVLRIETPRLCGVPGFSGDWGKGEVGQVACREIVEDDEVERRLVLGATETSKDRTPLPSWALLPPPGLKSAAGDQPDNPPSQQQQKPERTPEQEAIQAKWAKILKGQTAVLNQPVEPAGSTEETGDDAQQTASQSLESSLNELLKRALAIADGAVGDGEDRAAAFQALKRAGAELAAQHAAEAAAADAAASGPAAEGTAADDEPAADPLAGLSSWLSQAVIDAHTEAAENVAAGGVPTGTKKQPILVDLNLEELSDDEFYALFPNGLDEDDDANGLVYVTLEEDPEAESGWSVQVATAPDNGAFEAYEAAQRPVERGPAGRQAAGPRDEL